MSASMSEETWIEILLAFDALKMEEKHVSIKKKFARALKGNGMTKGDMRRAAEYVEAEKRKKKREETKREEEDETAAVVVATPKAAVEIKKKADAVTEPKDNVDDPAVVVVDSINLRGSDDARKKRVLRHVVITAILSAIMIGIIVYTHLYLTTTLSPSVSLCLCLCLLPPVLVFLNIYVIGLLDAHDS